ncbi:hypothetical protein ACFKHW_30780 [Bradyrhizobium lupini]|uniref:hypothetical protein n=1 Tax=Rhizobium lupini TaxID=136996 RepID=UPI00366B4A91
MLWKSLLCYSAARHHHHVASLQPENATRRPKTTQYTLERFRPRELAWCLEPRQDGFDRFSRQIRDEVVYLLSALESEQGLWLREEIEERASDLCVDGSGGE